MTSHGKYAINPPPRRSEPRGALQRGEKFAQRISHILALLHQGGDVDKKQLAAHFGVGVRTIERDLCDRLAGFVERTPEGRWQLTAAARSTIPATHLDKYARMAGVQDIFPDHTRPWLIGQLERPEAERGLLVHGTPQEDIPAQHFDALQEAVQQRHPCRFVYKGKARSAQPYRLIHKSGAWYLAALEDGATQLKVFSLARIQALQVNKNARFRHQQRHLDYLASQSDVWFTPSATTVRLRAAPEIAHYFQRRELLPQQDIFQNPDGSLQITARIHHPQQLLPVVRYWMPHLRIVQPGEWEQRLLDELRQTLAAWGGAEQEKQAATKPAKKPAKKPARPKRAKQ